MKLYAVLVEPNNEEIAEAIRREFGGAHYDFKDGQWFVAGDGTAKQICDKLGASSGDLDSIVVVSISGYFGYAQSDLWEWMAASRERQSNGLATDG